MTPENFVYWLQGFAEMHGGTPSEEQWEMIKIHLELVLDKKTNYLVPPCVGGGDNKRLC